MVPSSLGLEHLFNGKKISAHLLLSLFKLINVSKESAQDATGGFSFHLHKISTNMFLLGKMQLFNKEKIPHFLFYKDIFDMIELVQ